MQRPTLENVRIRSTRDALQIFYAVARHTLPIISRRLDAEERRAIVPGNVYVWEERCANSEATGLGMERWTDGMGWGPSRVRDEFLFYHQRESEAPEDPNNPSAKWASIMKREARPGVPSYSRSEAERLIKQTYSVHVSLPEDRPHKITRKWHLTAYFSQTTLDSLNTLDEIPNVGSLTVPQGWFRSARASKARRSEQTQPDEVPPPTQDQWSMSHQPPYGAVVHDAHSYSPSSRMPYPTPPPSHHYGYSEPHSPSRDYEAGPSHPPSSFPPRLPNLSDAGLGYYRDPSPFTQSSSASSELSSSPRPLSTPSAAPVLPAPRASSSRPRGSSDLDLVPLVYLESINRPARDPMDEVYLRRISTSKQTSSSSRFPQY